MGCCVQFQHPDNADMRDRHSLSDGAASGTAVFGLANRHSLLSGAPLEFITRTSTVLQGLMSEAETYEKRKK